MAVRRGSLALALERCGVMPLWLEETEGFLARDGRPERCVKGPGACLIPWAARTPFNGAEKFL